MAQIVIDIPDEFIAEVVEALEVNYTKRGNQTDLEFIKSVMLQRIFNLLIDYGSRKSAKKILDEKKLEFKNKFKNIK